MHEKAARYRRLLKIMDEVGPVAFLDQGQIQDQGRPDVVA